MADRAVAVRQTLCFQGHNLTIVAADGYPTKPLMVSCLDINLGQRCAATEAHSALADGMHHEEMPEAISLCRQQSDVLITMRPLYSTAAPAVFMTPYTPRMTFGVVAAQWAGSTSCPKSGKPAAPGEDGAISGI